MADGTRVRSRSVAMNRHPLGTKIRVRAVYIKGNLVSRTVQGMKHFVVRDRIGHSSELDFWSPSCSWSDWFGRRTVKYAIRRR